MFVFVTNQVLVFVAYILFIKQGVEKKLIVSVHLVGERWILLQNHVIPNITSPPLVHLGGKRKILKNHCEVNLGNFLR